MFKIKGPSMQGTIPAGSYEAQYFLGGGWLATEFRGRRFCASIGAAAPTSPSLARSLRS
jgi:hypothetical protein